jgi:hypothetical protein
MKRLVTHKSITRVVDTIGTGDMQMSSKKKIAAIVITTVALTASTVGISSAASKSSSTRVSITNPGALANKGPRGLDLTATLAALVAKGTITQAQADAIVAAANAARAAAEAARPLGEMDSRMGKNGKGEKGGMGGRGHGPMGAAPMIPAPTATPSASA